MIKERLVILGIAVVVLAVLVYDMMGKESPRGGDGVTEDEDYLLPHLDDSHLYKEADLDLVFFGEIRSREMAGLDLGPLTDLVAKADLVSAGLGAAPDGSDDKGTARFAQELAKKGFTSASLANQSFGASLSPGELAGVALALEEAKVEWFGPSSAPEGPGVVARTELPCGDKKVSIYQIGVSERPVPVAEREKTADAVEDNSRQEGAQGADSAEEGGADEERIDELFIGGIDVAAVAKQVKEIKEKEPDAVVLVHPHWGRDGNWKTPAQVKAARSWIEAGADYVMGHGAGMMQQVERHEGGWILHGLGDAAVSGEGDAKRFSLVARLTLREEGGEVKRRLKIYPVTFEKGEEGPVPAAVDARGMGKVYWDLIIKQWKRDDRWLKRQLWVGKDEFGRFVQLGFEEEKEVAK